jgi:hypothetical protein
LGVPWKPGNHDAVDGCQSVQSVRAPASQSGGNAIDLPGVAESDGYVIESTSALPAVSVMLVP